MLQSSDNPDGPLTKAEATKMSASLTAGQDSFYTIFTARSRNSSGYLFCAAMNPHPPRFQGFQGSRGDPFNQILLRFLAG